ncbi:MAG TPA: hypothetical protein VNM40_00585 [Candidatus Paceibacterota bacterium]|nr:hypothetical protein [Candidatus Paceibacterota bacterium]
MWYAIVLVALLASGPAVADARKDCMSGTPEQVIRGCTKLIETGRYRGHQLAIIYNNRGLAHERIAQWHEAVWSYTAALRHDRQLRTSLMGRARSYRELRQFDEAISDIMTLILLDPKIYEPRRALAFTYMLKEDYQAAVRAFSEAIEIFPRESDLYKGRVVARFKMAAKDQVRLNLVCVETMKDLDAMLVMRPNAWAYAVRGRCKVIRGYRQEAVEDLKKALELDPHDETARRELKNLGHPVP